MPKDLWRKANERARYGPARRTSKPAKQRRFSKPGSAHIPFPGFVVLKTDKAVGFGHKPKQATIWVPLSQLKGIDYPSGQTNEIKLGRITGFSVTSWWARQHPELRLVRQRKTRKPAHSSRLSNGQSSRHRSNKRPRQKHSQNEPDNSAAVAPDPIVAANV